jgi:hypothetical protein
VAPLTLVQVDDPLLALGDGVCHARLQGDLTLVMAGRRPLAPVPKGRPREDDLDGEQLQ